jgi:hypothetical protein
MEARRQQAAGISLHDERRGAFLGIIGVGACSPFTGSFPSPDWPAAGQPSEPKTRGAEEQGEKQRHCYPPACWPPGRGYGYTENSPTANGGGLAVMALFVFFLVSHAGRRCFTTHPTRANCAIGRVTRSGGGPAQTALLQEKEGRSMDRSADSQLDRRFRSSLIHAHHIMRTHKHAPLAR